MPGFLERMRDNAIANEIKNLANEEARLSAMHALKGYSKYAVPALIDVLIDPSRGAYAAVVLSDIGEPAIPALIDALGDDSRKSLASAALSEMCKKKSKTQTIIIPRLIDALADKEPGTRAMACAILKDLGAPALEPYIPSLTSSLGNADANEYAALVLTSIGKPVPKSSMNAVSHESKQEIASNTLNDIVKKDSSMHIPVTASQNTTPIPSPTINASPKPKFCKYCGASLAPDSAYCSECGKKVG